MATASTNASITAEERKVIFASSLGTIFEWYDFYLYATLAPFFGSVFFPAGNATANLLSALATYAAGFLVRPFGALVFGRVGDLVGRKYTFLVTISVMGLSTFAVGLLPTYKTLGVVAPLLLTSLRLLQGLALGGEYGGAVIYVAEHTRADRRGYSTSWIQTTATVGFFLSLIIIVLCRKVLFSDASFREWGWRVPFWFSLVLLAFSLYIRLRLSESPVFLRIKSEARMSKHPLKDSFLRYPNNKYVFLALFGAVAGQGVVWYGGQFYALFFLQNTLRLDWFPAYLLMAAALAIGTPMFLVFGRLSDRIGRRKIVLAGCAIAAISYFWVFKQLTHFTNPGLEEFRDRTAVSVASTDCGVPLFPTPGTKYSPCERVADLLTKRGLSFDTNPPVSGQAVVTKIGNKEIRDWNPPKPGESDTKYLKQLDDELKAQGYPGAPDTNYVMVIVILVFLIVLVTMVYAPIAALLVELFPANIRYTSMSLPYHLANGWIGGMMPYVATWWAASSGDIYHGIWYLFIFAVLTVVVGGIFLHDPRPDFDIHA